MGHSERLSKHARATPPTAPSSVSCGGSEFLNRRSSWENARWFVVINGSIGRRSVPSLRRYLSASGGWCAWRSACVLARSGASKKAVEAADAPVLGRGSFSSARSRSPQRSLLTRGRWLVGLLAGRGGAPEAPRPITSRRAWRGLTSVRGPRPSFSNEVGYPIVFEHCLNVRLTDATTYSTSASVSLGERGSEIVRSDIHSALGKSPGAYPNVLR